MSYPLPPPAYVPPPPPPPPPTYGGMKTSSYSPLAAIADQLAIIVHATVLRKDVLTYDNEGPTPSPTPPADPHSHPPSSASLEVEARAFERVTAVVSRVVEQHDARFGVKSSVEVKPIYPWRVCENPYYVAQQQQQQQLQQQSQGLNLCPPSTASASAPSPLLPTEGAASEGSASLIGAKSERREDGPPPLVGLFPTVAADGYGALAFTISCVEVSAGSSPATLLGALDDAFKVVRAQQMMTDAMRRATKKNTCTSAAAAAAPDTTAAGEDAPPSSSTAAPQYETRIDVVGFLDAGLVETLPKRPLTAAGAAIERGGVTNTSTNTATEESANSQQQQKGAAGSESEAAAAFEDKVCAVLVEGFLDAVPLAADGTPTLDANAFQTRLSEVLVPATFAATAPSMAPHLQQTYGARLVVLHPAAVREAFLSPSSSAEGKEGEGSGGCVPSCSSVDTPLGLLAARNESALGAYKAALIGGAAAGLENPFTVHCFFDFTASTVLTRPAAAPSLTNTSPPPQERVAAKGKMFFAFLPSHPQAEALAQHLKHALTEQKVFNGNPIRVHNITGKQFVRALRSVKDV